jgi:hypothetical protein
MVWFVVMHLVGLIVDFIGGVRGEADEKELQIALRHQVRLLQRRLPRVLCGNAIRRCCRCRSRPRCSSRQCDACEG